MENAGATAVDYPPSSGLTTLRSVSSGEITGGGSEISLPPSAVPPVASVRPAPEPVLEAAEMAETSEPVATAALIAPSAEPAAAAEAAAAGSAVVFAGVYPHAWYKPHHLPALRRVGCGALDVL